VSVEDLIRLMEARLAALNSARGSAASIGDVEQVTRLDADIVTTQTTLDQLRSLL
jgi:hypothetical protein